MIEFDTNEIKVYGKPHVEYGYNVCGCINGTDDIVVDAWVWDADAALALAKYLLNKFDSHAVKDRQVEKFGDK